MTLSTVRCNQHAHALSVLWTRRGWTNGYARIWVDSVRRRLSGFLVPIHLRWPVSISRLGQAHHRNPLNGPRLLLLQSIAIRRSQCTVVSYLMSLIFQDYLSCGFSIMFAADAHPSTRSGVRPAHIFGLSASCPLETLSITV